MSTNSSDPTRVTIEPSAPTTRPEPGLAVLVGGVVSDVQKLIGQHLEMFQQEIRDDFRKTMDAGRFVGWAVGLGVAAGALLIAMLVGLLSWAIPAVPWWGWCGGLSLVAAFIAVALYHVGRQKFAAFNPLPDETVAAMKGSADWITDRISGEQK